MSNEIDELIKRSRQEGAELYSTLQFFQKIGTVCIAIFGVIGVIMGFAFMMDKFFGGVLVIAGAGALCYLLYAIQIVITNTSKVFVHLLFSNIVIMERGIK